MCINRDKTRHWIQADFDGWTLRNDISSLTKHEFQAEDICVFSWHEENFSDLQLEWKRVFYIEIMTKVFFRQPHCDVVSHWLRRTIMTFSGPDYIIIIRTSCAHQSQISFCHKDSVVIRLPVDNSSILVPGKINFSSPVQFLETLSWYQIIKKDRE